MECCIYCGDEVRPGGAVREHLRTGGWIHEVCFATHQSGLVSAAANKGNTQKVRRDARIRAEQMDQFYGETVAYDN